jgi:hypothetical protein
MSTTYPIINARIVNDTRVFRVVGFVNPNNIKLIQDVNISVITTVRAAYKPAPIIDLD